MARIKNKYYTERSGTKIGQDIKNVPSDCNVITFSNFGDCEVIIISAGGSVRRRLTKDQDVSFGSDLPSILERDKFSIEFDGVGTKELYIERATYQEEPECN